MRFADVSAKNIVFTYENDLWLAPIAGGTAQDIWVGSFAKKDYHKITEFVGTDNFPMWDDADHIYFNSDR